MGVSGLLTLLKSIQKPTHVREYSGQTVGVDAYGWLHRGAVPCAIDLASGKPTTKYVDFAMHRVRMLVHFGVTPYLVFDGDHLPSKAATEKSRAERRRESKNSGLELLKMGKTAQAYQELRKSVDITPEMAVQLIQELKRHNIQYVVAPYEADSQLAYLEREGIIDAILSEDSDLLVFGAKTLLTKLDQYGACVAIRQADFGACRGVNLTGWTVAEFRRMAILSGCDYLDGIHHMGLKTAHRFVRKCKDMQRLIQCAQLEGKFRIPSDYLASFMQAEMTFLYQWVYCPKRQQLVHLTRPESESQLEGITYIGAYVEPQVARQIASGDLNPFTKLPIIIHRTHNIGRPALLSKRVSDENHEGKKIDSFFGPKRVPLAEIDPNTLTPSPSQQRLIQENAGRSWPRVSSDSQSQNALNRISDIPRGRQTTSLATPSLPPRKRPRLCSEVEMSASASASMAVEERSKFFASPQVHSQAAGCQKKTKKKRTDFSLWSDDSVEDGLAELPDLVSATTTVIESKEGSSQREIAIARSDATTSFGQKTASSTDVERPLHVHEPEVEEDESPFSATLLARTRALRERYSFTPLKVSQGKNAAPEQPLEHAHTEPMTPPQSKLQKHLEPLENAPPDSFAVQETPVTRRDAQVDFEAPESVQYNRNAETNDDEVVSTSARDQLQTRILRAKGSEDLLIVPDSDASSEGVPSPQVKRLKYFEYRKKEDTALDPGGDGQPGAEAVPQSDAEEEEEDEEPSVTRPVLDLRKFAFSATPG